MLVNRISYSFELFICMNIHVFIKSANLKTNEGCGVEVKAAVNLFVCRNFNRTWGFHCVPRTAGVKSITNGRKA